LQRAAVRARGEATGSRAEHRANRDDSEQVRFDDGAAADGAPLARYARMATRAMAPDFVTVASLHAALDGIVEIEQLFSRMNVPSHALPPLEKLAAELRVRILGLLRAESTWQPSE
jgi:hypothetical protein